MKVTDDMYQKLTMPTYRAGIAMASAHRQLRALKADILKPHSLTMAQWSVLGIVFDAGDEGVTMSSIANQLGATQAFVSTNVSSLEDKGLVERQTAVNDQRVSVISLTSGTAATVEQIEQDLRAKLRSTVYSDVSREELAVFMHLLSIFAEY